MKIDFSSVMTDRDGKVILKSGAPDSAPTTLALIAITALDATEIDAQGKPVQIKGDEKYRRGRLADRIWSAQEPIDLSANQIVLLKEVIGKTFGPLIVRQAWDILDPKDEKDDR